LITGAWIDHTAAASAEWHIGHQQAKLHHNAAHGDWAAANNNARRIDLLQNRIMVNEWLVQKNLYDCTGYYPFPRLLDPQTYCAIAQYHTPPRPPGRW
jgi:hypothetical protein